MKLKNITGLTKRFFQDWKEFSFPVAFGRLRRDVPIGKWEKRRTFYENRVYRYLEKRYAPVIDQCIENHDASKEQPIKEKYIWTMWWQGEDQMPPIVKTCYQQLLRVSVGYTVTLITHENWDDYVTLPDHIVEKYKKGIIGPAHFSDVLRIALLNRWGGLWLDATVYSCKIPVEAFEIPFYTLHSPGLFPDFISRGKFSTFVLGFSYTSSLITSAIGRFFDAYWEKHNMAIDYLFFDYALCILSSHSRNVHTMISSLIENRQFYNLNVQLNRPIEKGALARLLEASPLHKLSYRQELQITDTDGNLTVFGHLLNRIIS